MPKPFPLQSLLDLSLERMDEAARHLGRLLACEQEVEKTLEMLLQYREEYRKRFREAAQNGMGRDQWSNYRSFLGRLDEAVEQQRQLLARSRQQTAAGQQAWLAQRTKVKAFDTLAQRHKALEARTEGRAEQRAQDEHAAKNGVREKE
jgi:flagellar FliJ protein